MSISCKFDCALSAKSNKHQPPRSEGVKSDRAHHEHHLQISLCFDEGQEHKHRGIKPDRAHHEHQLPFRLRLEGQEQNKRQPPRPA